MEILKNKINEQLSNFKQNYIESFIYWNVKEMETKRENINLCRINFRSIHQKNITLRQVNSFFNNIELNKSVLERKANENFNKKLDTLIKKLISFDIDVDEATVEYAENNTDLEFLVSDSEKEIHSRVIFAQGAIKAPHYRFITTKRNK